ncbi:hypothetical protein ACFO25_09880 [Paenactinomyces guangxiensis]|uniref:Gp28/Gp37-like domain-containing protein n=1 Tax=Paenactinomyces guangxiensis TaxID=1490290 RepID=A0A7W2A9P5_9BACL|nr:hypothetical protein [Paenactinomyces guangxiensis]MBA4495093.1 hypothetical protein [Paenactinomyces guangxiensis]MBH8592223.1 hypothetical protein [Paenactinomyces guangxiensis]
MTCSNYQIFIRRNSDLKQVQQISKYKRLEMVKRRNKVGSWLLEVDFDCTELRHEYQNEQFGLEVWRNGSRFFTGPLTRIERRKNGEERTLTLSGADEKIYLTSELALPDPWHYTTTFNSAYDSRSGAAERVLKNYIDLNIGPNAVAERKIPGLVIETNQDRGNNVYYIARFDKLLKVCQDIILHIPGYNFDIVVNDSNKLEFKLVPWVDRWAKGVEFSERLRNLIGYDYTYERPDRNFVLVGGGQDGGTTPVYRKFAYSGNEWSRNRWGNVVEFIDKRGTVDVNELKQAAWDALKLEDGKEKPDENMIGKINVTAQITQVKGGPEMGKDWDLGDFVKVTIHQGGPGQEIAVYDYIKEIAISLTEERAEEIRALVGSDDVITTNGGPVPYIVDSLTHIEEKLRSLEGAY